MKLGDKLIRRPHPQVYEHMERPQDLPCTVVYIHPQRRFYTVEFRFSVTGYAFRESYFFPDRLGDMYPQERKLKNAKNRDHE